MKKLTYAIIIILIQVAIINASFKVRDVITEITAEYTTSGTQDMIALVNEERKIGQLQPLTENDKLNQSAQMKCQDMIDKNYWDHIAPDGIKPWAFFKKVGYNYDLAGENLVTGIPDGQAIVELMGSQSHMENIMNPKFTEIGIGRCGEYMVQHFGKQHVYR